VVGISGANNPRFTRNGYGQEPALNRLFLSCLDREWYDSVHEIIVATVRAVCLTPKFTQYHRYAIFDLGFNLHYVGEEGSATKRISQRAPDSLQDARSLFLSQITSIRHSVVDDNDPESVTEFCTLLQRLAESGIGPMYVSSQVWEILEDGYGHGLTDPDALEALANTIGVCRRHVDEISVFEDGNEYLDRVSAHLALYIVKLGRKSQLQRMMGNAWFGRRKQLPSQLVMTNGFDEEIYTAVAKELGYKGWPNSARNRGRDFSWPRFRGRRPLRGQAKPALNSGWLTLSIRSFSGFPKQPAHLVGYALADAVEHVLIPGGVRLKAGAIAVVILAAAGGVTWLRLSHSPASRASGQQPPLGEISAGDGPPADPFAGTPAENWANGESGIVIPAAKPVGSFTAAQVMKAYQTTRQLLIAANLDK
jgi:hypothetical protein